MKKIIRIDEIQTKITEFRGQKVILDSDLANLYGASTRRLLEQVKRNQRRFPFDFMFQLTKEEWLFWKSQFATSGSISSQKKKLPYVFTRNGANMVSAVLRSRLAIQRSIQIMRAFSTLEEIMSTNKKRKIIMQSPEVINKLSAHSKAIMRLFHESKINTYEIAKVKRVVNEMIEVLKQNVFKF